MRIPFALARFLWTAMLFLPTASPQATSFPSKCEGQFLKLFSLADNEACIFTVSGSYVLQAIYYGETTLGEVRIVPRYFFHDTHPDWAEPDEPVVMTSGEYRSLLTRIQEIAPLGRLLKEGDIGVTLNLRTLFRDVYREGVVEREMFRDSPEKSYDVASFRLLYFRNISGKLESVEPPSIQMPDQNHRIRIDGKWYWTIDASPMTLVPGHTISIPAAGPINDEFVADDGHHR